MVTGPTDSPRQGEVTNQGQGPPTEISQEQEERARAVEATCNVGPNSFWEAVSEAKLPAMSLQHPSKRPSQRQSCNKDWQCGSGVHPEANTAGTSAGDRHTSNVAQENMGT